MMKGTKNISRREFLLLATKGLLAASGLLGLGGVARILSYPDGLPKQVTFDLGLQEDYPQGSKTLLKQVPAILIHDKAGFRAISLTCTHLGCEVEPAGEGFACPCHGSQFTQDGKVIRGPAAQPLKSLKIEQKPDGQLILHL
jgi:Rieske Fe-S protein